MWHNLWLHFGVDEHPFVTYFDAYEGYRVTHSQMKAGWSPADSSSMFFSASLSGRVRVAGHAGAPHGPGRRELQLCHQRLREGRRARVRRGGGGKVG